MGDVIFIIAFLGLLLIPFVIKKMWYWVGTIASMGVCLGVGEAISKACTGATLSKTFWNYSLTNPVVAWIMLLCMFLAWVLLMIHLAWKMINKKPEVK
jgi:hypothetical protein